LRFGFVALTIALSIARCWRWIADTAALVHQPAIVLAQVNMMLRGVAFMCPRGELQMSERLGASLAPHQPCSGASAHYIQDGASLHCCDVRPRRLCLGAPGILQVERGAGVTLQDQAPDHPHGITQGTLARFGGRLSARRSRHLCLPVVDDERH
jgi:hypothetical protein